MHEIAIANNIIDEAKKYGNVQKIILEIGELAHVPCNEFIATLKSLINWDIVYEEKKAIAKCECGFNGHPKIVDRGHDSFLIECPECKSVPDVLNGTEIILKKVVVE